MGTNKKHFLKLHVKSIYQLMNSFDAEGSEHNTNMETQTTIRQFLKSHLKAKKSHSLINDFNIPVIRRLTYKNKKH